MKCAVTYNRTEDLRCRRRFPIGPVLIGHVQIASSSNNNNHSTMATTNHALVFYNSNSVRGIIHFYQLSPESNGVLIRGTIDGLPKNSTHGIHIHNFGDLSNGCDSAGPHFNPYNMSHGGPFDMVRHAGDLGNLVTDNDGSASIDMLNPILRLHGPTGIVGRAVVIHADPDDYGRGPYEDSRTTGHAGKRIACAIIGLAAPVTITVQ